VRVVDVDSREVLLDGLPQRDIGTVAWLADGTGFYYVAEYVAEPRQNGGDPEQGSRVYLKRLALDTPPELQALRIDPPAWRVTVSPDGRYALAYGVDQRPHYLRDLAADSSWEPFLGNVRATFGGTVVGDRFVAITDHGAPNGRLVAIPLATPTEPSTWTELLAAGDSVLLTVNPVGERLVVGEHVGGATRLRVLHVEGTIEAEIPLPGEGLAWLGPDRGGGLVAPGDDECTFVFSSLTSSPATYRYDLATGDLETLTPPEALVDNVAVHHRTARASDGTPIPYMVVARADLDLSAPHPTVISAYGALANPWPPAYLFTLPAAWVQLGGVYVHAHPRGGGEFGPQWWRAARRQTKQRTFDDLYAVAEELIARGQTTPRQLGVFGTSAGSLPAAVAITQRPDLFRASVPMLPLLDLLRCRQDPTTMAAIVRPELGDPDDPRDARVLHAYSPYHHIQEGTAYPAVLLDCGATNHICPAWHGRKMAARLQHATSSAHPILLRVRDCGHNPQMTPAQMQERETEELAFFAAELGL
jgi:prolyl oligopeptidase